MEKVTLGRSGIEVSKLGLGSLTMGRLQKNSTTAEIDAVTAACVDNGINFVDGAQLYESYEVLKFMAKHDKNAVLATKSYAYDEKTAKEAFEQALRETGRDYIDIFLMHEQESELTLRGHHEAFNFYKKMQKEGKIRAVGISTHKIECVKATRKFPEIDVIHPLINYKGYGLFDGTLSDMENAISDAHERGVGVYSMKIFGGGHLLHERQKAVEYILGKKFIDASVIGMQTPKEVEYNVALFERRSVENINAEILNKKVAVEDWCVKCMSCAKACPQNAISLVNDVVTVDESKCVLCGYCGSACENMCIKLF